MRTEITKLKEELEAQRIARMAWWKNSDEYLLELKLSRTILETYKYFKESCSKELQILLDRVEEEYYFIKEAELQAVYMQAISDCMDIIEKKGNLKDPILAS